MTTTLGDLSQFTIERIVASDGIARLFGLVTRPEQLRPGVVLLHFSIAEKLQGTLSFVDEIPGQAIFETDSQDVRPPFCEGATFPAYDAYWNNEVYLVLNRELHWKAVRFTPKDAFVAPAATPGWRQWRIATSDDVAQANGEIIRGGWDHEHCGICNLKISEEDSAYLAEPEPWWVCEACYRKWVSTADLEFIVSQ